MRKILLSLSLLLLVIILTACSKSSAPSQNPTSTHPLLPQTATPSPTRTPSPTVSYTSTGTDTPTATPKPSLIIRPKQVGTVGNGLMGLYERSLDGKIVAYTGGNSLYWVDASSGEQLGSVQLEGDWFSYVYISPDNRWIVVRSGFGADVVDTISKEVYSCCYGGMGSSFGYRFSSDSRYMAYIGADSSTGGSYHFVGVYDFEKLDNVLADSNSRGNPVYTVMDPDNYHSMSAPAISPDNLWLAAGFTNSSHELLYIWKLLSGEIHLTVPHPARVNAVAFSPDGRFLATACRDGLVRLFDPQTGRLDRIINGFLDSITSVSFSADGRQINISVDGQPDQVYDLSAGSIHTGKPEDNPVNPYVKWLHEQGFADGSGVLFSPDGETLAIGGHSVQLWDISENRVLVSLENPYGILIGWIFRPDGLKLAGITKDEKVLLWDTDTGELELVFDISIVPIRQVDYQYENRVAYGVSSERFTEYGLDFSPDGRLLAFGNGNTIEIWDVSSGTLINSLQQSLAPAFATRVSFSKDGNLLYAVINRNQEAQVWNVHSGRLLKQLNLPIVNQNAYTATALNGMLFARNNANDDGNWIELWHLDTGEMFKLDSIDRETVPIGFSPDGSLLVAESSNRMYIWQTSTGMLLHWMMIDRYISKLAISPDSSTLAIGMDGIAQLWDISDFSQIAMLKAFASPTPPTTSTPWSWDSSSEGTATPIPTRLVTFPAQTPISDKVITSENASRLSELARFGNGKLQDISWSSEGAISGAQILSAGSVGVFSYTTDPFVQTSHYPTDFWVESITRLQSGEILAAGVISQSLQIWNVTMDNRVLDLAGGLGPVRINPAGNLLVYGDIDGNLRVYDLVSRQEVVKLYTAYRANHLLISPDDRYVAAVDGYDSRLGSKQFIRIWEIKSGKIVSGLGGPDAPITDLAYSRDGKLLVGAAGGSAWVWDVRPWIEPVEFPLYAAEINRNLTLYHKRVTTTALSPDNILLAVGDSERNIWLYDCRSRSLLLQLTGHSAPLAKLRFNADGSRLLSADIDGNMILWEPINGTRIAELAAHTGQIGGLVIQEDGKLRAWDNNTTWLLNPRDGSLIESTSIYTGTILAASPVGNMLAVSNRLSMSIWDARTGELVQKLSERANADPWVEHMFEGIILPGFYEASFSADGKQFKTKAPYEEWVYSLDSVNQFELIDTRIGGFDNITDSYERSTMSTDGKLIVRTMQMYQDVPILTLLGDNEQEMNHLTFPEDSRITALAFSPDSRLLAVGLADGSISFVDVSKWEIIATIQAHPYTISDLVFSANGETLIFAGTDGTIRFWGLR